MNRSLFVFIVCFSSVGSVATTTTHAADRVVTSWGKLVSHSTAPDAWEATVDERPVDGRLTLPDELAEILRVTLSTDGANAPFSEAIDGQPRSLFLPVRGEETKQKLRLIMETAKTTGQMADGRIAFLSRNAQTKGVLLQLDDATGRGTLGPWTDPEGRVFWTYEATRPGRYSVEATIATEGAGAELEARLRDAVVRETLPKTNGRFVSHRLGIVSIPAPGGCPLELRLAKPAKAGVFVKAVQLRPVSEGKFSVQDDETGEVRCHARDVVIHGVKVQWEPKPEKQTVGYWVNVSDWISWDFAVKTPGLFDVEILQGCGKGHGGSVVELTTAGQPLEFTVEDTGHFQNFVPRVIGRVRIATPGEHEIVVRPKSKKSVAVMDLRQVRLIPVKP